MENSKIWRRNGTRGLPSFEISIFSNFVPKISRQNRNLCPQHHDSDIEFMIFVSQLSFSNLNPGSFFGSHLISGPQNVKSAALDIFKSTSNIFASKFEFAFDQNLHFVLGSKTAQDSQSSSQAGSQSSFQSGSAEWIVAELKHFYVQYSLLLMSSVLAFSCRRFIN